MSRLPQVPEDNAAKETGVKPCGLPSVACPADGGGPSLITRREAAYKIGSWSIYLGVLGGAAALGGACSGGGAVGNQSTGTPTPGGTTPAGSGTPTATGSGTVTPTPTPAPTFVTNTSCECENDSTFMTDGQYIATTLLIQDIPPGAVALNSSVAVPTYAYVIICNDTGMSITPGVGAGGFYAISGLCTHAQIPEVFPVTAGDLSGGFLCHAHQALFTPNGAPNGTKPGGGGGVGGSPLPHFALASDSSGQLWVNVNQIVTATCRC